jgi:hypothetical protein
MLGSLTSSLHSSHCTATTPRTSPAAMHLATFGVLCLAATCTASFHVDDYGVLQGDTCDEKCQIAGHCCVSVCTRSIGLHMHCSIDCMHPLLQACSICMHGCAPFSTHIPPNNPCTPVVSMLSWPRRMSFFGECVLVTAWLLCNSGTCHSTALHCVGRSHGGPGLHGMAYDASFFRCTLAPRRRAHSVLLFCNRALTH